MEQNASDRNMRDLVHNERTQGNRGSGLRVVSRGVSRRALILAFCLIPLNTFYMVKGIVAFGGFYFGTTFFPNSLSLLLALALINLWLKRKYPARALRTGEILSIYCIIALSTSFVWSVWCVGGTLPATITYPFWFASAENAWKERLWPYFPTWLTVRDQSAVEGFWVGEVNPYSWGIIKSWATPTLWWASFLGAVFFVTLCFNSIFRRRWDEEERLPFPFVTVPVQIADERFGLFRKKVWWMGAGISFGLSAWGVLASFIPALPSIPLSVDWYANVVNRFPLSVMVPAQFTGISWQPIILGVCYLIPQDMLFSLFAFGIFFITEVALSHLFALAATSQGFPYAEYQTYGGYVGLALALIWLDRRYLAQVARRSLGLPTTLREDGKEALGYRVAVLGLLLGIYYCCWFWTRAGLSWWLVFALLAVYLGFSLVISRIRAQVGSPIQETWDAPGTLIRAAFGTLALGPKAMGMSALLHPFLFGHQDNNPSPIQMESLKMAEGGRMERHRLAMAFVVVIPITIILSFWAHIHFGYQVGIGSAKAGLGLSNLSRMTIDAMDSFIRQPTEANMPATLAMGFGLILTEVLLFLRLRFPWWPLHPIAFPISHSWWMHNYILMIFTAWLIKTLVMRYGGLRAHRAVLPFFIGLIVGECAALFLRSIMFLAFHVGT